MSCDNIDDVLTRESGRIGPWVYDRTITSSPWLRFIKRDKFPEGLGYSINVFTSERVFGSSDNPTWSDVSVSDGNSSSVCLPSAEALTFGQTLRSFNLQQKAFNGPDLCIEDLKTSWQIKQQLGKTMESLASLTDWVWTNRYKYEYLRIAKKAYAKAGIPTGTTSGFAYVPTSPLTQGVLDKIYGKQIRDGAGRNALAMSEGRPVFGLICSQETSDFIIRGNTAVRDDYRRIPDAQKELLAPLGIDRSYRGFVHVVDPYPPRYDLVANVLTRRETWTSSSTTNGNKWEINTDWEAAEYEVSFVFHQDVYHSMVNAPMSSAGGNTAFDPQTYMGDFKWLNIQDKACNPDKTIGFHRARFMDGSQPVHPEFGYAILHKRCPNDNDLVTCSYS